MRVLMVNHPDAENFRGGDLTQMRETAAALRPLGVEVAESFDAQPDATAYDVAHVFNLRTVAVTPGQMAHLKAQDIPVVLSPIYLNPAVALWGGRGVFGAFQDDPPPELLAQRLRGIAERTMRVHSPDGGPVLTADAANRPHPNYDQLQREALRHADLVLCNSWLEVHAMFATLHAPNMPVAVAPLGVNPTLFAQPDPAPFVAKYGLQDFVLQVGRIEVIKNQLLLAHALQGTGLKLVLLGGNRQPQFLDLVRKIGGDTLTIIPHLPPAEVASAYAAARVHVLPSWAETCGLVNLEAALAGCSVVAGCLGYEVEYLTDHVDYCDPGDAGSIRAAVTSAWEGHAQRATRREALRRPLSPR